MSKKRFVVLIICLIVVFLMAPVALDIFIFGNNVSSNLNNSEWASFFGGYIGAFISIIGVLITIFFTQSQNRKDRELQVRPYFDIKFKRCDDLYCAKKVLGFISFGLGESPQSVEDTAGPVINDMLLFKNVGLGVATNYTLKYSILGNNRKIYPILIPPTKNPTSNCIQPNEEASLSLNIDFNCAHESIESVLKDGCTIDEYKADLIEVKKRNEEYHKTGTIAGKEEVLITDLFSQCVDFSKVSALSEKYKGFKIEIEFTFNDILDNKYQQSLELSISYGASTSDLIVEHHVETRLTAVSNPKKIHN